MSRLTVGEVNIKMDAHIKECENRQIRTDKQMKELKEEDDMLHSRINRTNERVEKQTVGFQSTLVKFLIGLVFLLAAGLSGVVWAVVLSGGLK